MDNVRLRHDAAWKLATACVEKIAHLYRPEEVKELHSMFYEAAQASLIYYETHAVRQRERLGQQ